MASVAAIAFALFGIHVGPHRVHARRLRARRGARARERIAYVIRGDLWVADAGRDASRRCSCATPTSLRGARTAGGSPSSARGWVWTVRADGLDERRLARGAHPDWSPDGSRVAFDRDGETYTARWWYGGAQSDAGAGTDPAYAPDGRLAVVRDGQIVVGGNVVATADRRPTGLPTASSRGCATA